jgi:hypothetical protein
MNRWGIDTLLRLSRGVVRKADFVVPEPAEVAVDTQFTRGKIGTV